MFLTHTETKCVLGLHATEMWTDEIHRCPEVLRKDLNETVLPPEGGTFEEHAKRIGVCRRRMKKEAVSLVVDFVSWLVE